MIAGPTSASTPHMPTPTPHMGHLKLEWVGGAPGGGGGGAPAAGGSGGGGGGGGGAPGAVGGGGGGGRVPGAGGGGGTMSSHLSLEPEHWQCQLVDWLL